MPSSDYDGLTFTFTNACPLSDVSRVWSTSTTEMSLTRDGRAPSCHRALALAASALWLCALSCVPIVPRS